MGATEDSRALMWRITDEIWNGGRMELIDELIAEDLVDHVDLPGLGKRPCPVSSEHRDDSRGLPGLSEPFHFVLADEAFAVSYGRSTGTHQGEFMGIPPTGRSFDVPTFGILRFENGQAVERWGMSDNLAVLQQLGLMG